MADRSIQYADLWKIYKESDRYKEQIIHWMNLRKNLPILPWKTQLEVLDNAPIEVIKAHADLLDERARKKLGLEETRKKTKWTYGSLA